MRDNKLDTTFSADKILPAVGEGAEDSKNLIKNGVGDVFDATYMIVTGLHAKSEKSQGQIWNRLYGLAYLVGGIGRIIAGGLTTALTVMPIPVVAREARRAIVRLDQKMRPEDVVVPPANPASIPLKRIVIAPAPLANLNEAKLGQEQIQANAQRERELLAEIDRLLKEKSAAQKKDEKVAALVRLQDQKLKEKEKELNASKEELGAAKRIERKLTELVVKQREKLGASSPSPAQRLASQTQANSQSQEASSSRSFS